VSITKLSHGLWISNAQNEKFYGHSNTCPFFRERKETIEHIFASDHETARKERNSAISTYKATLIGKGTPPQLVETLVWGIMIGVAQSPSYTNFSPPAIGQEECIEQGVNLGWVAFLQGYISQKWMSRYQASVYSRSTQDSQTWEKHLILANWTYSKSIWAGRNAVVHGRGTVETEGKLITMLKQRIRELVPYTRTHLFDRPLLVLQQLPRENMQCWIRSAEEAISTQQSREALHGELSRQIMAKFLARQTQSPSTTIVSLNQPISSLSGVPHLTLKANTGKTPSGIHLKLCSRGRPRPIHRTSRLGQQRRCRHEVSSSIVRH
jgi:hypothetical protein